jgi:hypothetical protein
MGCKHVHQGMRATKVTVLVMNLNAARFGRQSASLGDSKESRPAYKAKPAFACARPWTRKLALGQIYAFDCRQAGANRSDAPQVPQRREPGPSSNIPRIRWKRGLVKLWCSDIRPRVRSNMQTNPKWLLWLGCLYPLPLYPPRRQWPCAMTNEQEPFMSNSASDMDAPEAP